jgi:hypothetical protein
MSEAKDNLKPITAFACSPDESDQPGVIGEAVSRPWEYGKARNYEGFYIAPQGTLPTLAAVERCGDRLNIQCFNFPGQTEANARLIVRAVNTHDELLGLAKGYLRYLEVTNGFEELKEQVKKIIAKAKGE